MYKLICSILVGLFLPICILANDYEKAWEAISQKDLRKAKELLESAQKDPKYTVDATLTLVLLEAFEGRKEKLTSFDKIYSSTDNPYSYLYALWFYEAAIGDYGKKTKEQLKLLHRIQKDAQSNGTLKAASYYSEGMHFLKSNDFKNAKKRYSEIGGLRAWQFVGPFENTLGSGFDKNYPPIAKAEKSAVFNSKGNFDISWFSPPQSEPESWMFVGQHVNDYDAIVYAQTFVYSDSDQEVYICAGINGSLKVWVNDQLLIKEEKEVTTELDTYKNKAQLKKGYNRVLVQVGFSSSNTANFMVRITDKNYHNIPNLKESSSSQDYPKVGGDVSDKMLSLFAVDYFKQKIEQEPKNPINYVLLSKAYIRAAQKNKARATIDKGLALYPDNVLLRTELISTYLVLENRTGILREIDWIKKNLPNNYYPLSVEVSELIQDEKYKEAELVLKKMIDAYGKDESTYLSEIKLAKAQGEREKLLSLIKASYRAYPDNSTFTALQYSIEKEMNNDGKKAIQVLEKFCAKTYEYKMVDGLIDEYKNQGNAEGMLNLLNELHEGFPYEVTFMRELALFYFLIKRYDKAISYMEQAVAQGPYRADVWNGMGIIYEQKGATSKAIESYEKSLLYDANQYDLRHKVNKLRGLDDLTQHLPNEDEYEAIGKTVITEDKKGRDWYYIFNKTYKILFPKGACEEYHSLSAKVLNKPGIDYWKSIQIPYDSYRESVVIEKAEVIKKSGQKIEAERNRNSLVFTDLEVEDVVYIKYKIQNYNYGRFSQDFWDKFNFNSFVPTDYSSYCLLAPSDVAFEYEMQNADLKPKVETFGEYKRYWWEAKDLAPLESEIWMPTINDVGMNLHISTIKNWKEVAEWYSAISKTQAKIDFDLEELLKEILPNEMKDYSDLEKARRIYDYIVRNINYSSIPFRQSAYVPQKPGKTFQTKLGDCKDVSTLFATLGRKAGLDVSLVLVDTRDNGLKDLILPSLNFNHCIAKLNLEDGPRYLELTNSNLPFGSLTSALLDATILDIPTDMNNLAEVPKLATLTNFIRTPNELHRNKTITIEGRDLTIKTQTVRVGSLSSYTRDSYLDLDEKRQRENMAEAINSDYNNPVELVDLTFEDLENLKDTLVYNYKYIVKNEVINIGGMQTFKIPFSDLTISPEVFAKKDRQYPIDYDIETDLKHEELTIEIGEGQSFVEIPEDVRLESKGLVFSITYKKIAENKLQVSKKYIPVRKQFGAEDYEDLKSFFNAVITSEGQYLAFKAK